MNPSSHVGQPSLTGEFVSGPQLLAMPDLFILAKDHRRFLEGKMTYFRPVSLKRGAARLTVSRGCSSRVWSVLVSVPMVVVGVGLLWWGATQGVGVETRLWGGGLIVFAIVAFFLFAATNATGRRLGHDGHLLCGQIVAAAWIEDPSAEYKDEYALQVQYVFQPPTGPSITDTAVYAQGRVNIKRDAPPVVGRPVAVLYVSEHLFALV